MFEEVAAEETKMKTHTSAFEAPVVSAVAGTDVIQDKSSEYIYIYISQT